MLRAGARIGATVAAFVPFVFGCLGLIIAIVSLTGVRVLGERRVAVRGLLLAIANLAVPIAIGAVMISFDQLSAACGGG